MNFSQNSILDNSVSYHYVDVGLQCRAGSEWKSVEEKTTWSDAVIMVGDTLEVLFVFNDFGIIASMPFI